MTIAGIVPSNRRIENMFTTPDRSRRQSRKARPRRQGFHRRSVRSPSSDPATYNGLVRPPEYRRAGWPKHPLESRLFQEVGGIRRPAAQIAPTPECGTGWLILARRQGHGRTSTHGLPDWRWSAWNPSNMIGEMLVLAHERRGGHLGDHQAGIKARLRCWNGGRSCDSVGSTINATRRWAIAPISATASAIGSAAKATGSCGTRPTTRPSCFRTNDCRLPLASISWVRPAKRRMSIAAPATRG